MRRVAGKKPTKIEDRSPADLRRLSLQRHPEENRSHFLEAQAESGRQMRVFIQEHCGEAE
jgi:hypothetical protein